MMVELQFEETVRFLQIAFFVLRGKFMRQMRDTQITKENSCMKKKMLVVLSMVIVLLVLITVPERVEGETYEYDDLNRVIKVTYDDGSYITYEYDKNGNITGVKVHEAATSEQKEETTKKPQETTSKQEQTTTKKPQETTEKQQEQETTKKPAETTKKPQETTKKPQETTKKPQETMKKPQETTKKVQTPLRGEEETIGPQNVFSPSGIGNGAGTDGMVSPPVISHLPGVQAFDVIKTILESYKGVSASGGQKTAAQQNDGSQSINGNQGNSGVQTGENGQNGSGKGDKEGNKSTGSQTQNRREQAKEYINKKFPKITKFTLKFVIGIMRTYMSLGR